MELTHKEVKNIIEIIDEAEHLDEIELVFSGFRLHVRRAPSSDGSVRSIQDAPISAAPAAKQGAPAPSRAIGATETSMSEGEVAIRAPMLGTFYRSPSPGEKPFVEVGDGVKAGDTVCVIEVMKLFNTIRAGVDGTVVRIAVENESLVEYNQVMVVIARTPKV